MSSGWYVGGSGYVQGVCLGLDMSRRGGYPPPPGYGSWDITGYGEQVGGIHSTEMLSCGNYYNCAMFKNFGLLKRARYQNV